MKGSLKNAEICDTYFLILSNNVTSVLTKAECLCSLVAVVVNLEQIHQIIQVILFLTLNIKLSASYMSAFYWNVFTLEAATGVVM